MDNCQQPVCNDLVMGVAFEVLVAHGATWFPTAFVTIVAARGEP